jgi:hypothetical protein
MYKDASKDHLSNPKQDQTPSYEDWNLALLKHFFGEHMANQQVRLIIDGQLLDSAFRHLGGLDGYLYAMHSGPNWYPCKWTDLNERVHALHRQWHILYKSYPSRCKFPDQAPYFFAYLCLACLAWTISPGEGHQANTYYARLENLYPKSGVSAQNITFWTDKLWPALEEWTESLNGRRGIFKVDALGHMRHVGIPKAQVIISHHHVEKLPNLFWHANLSAQDHTNTSRVREHLLASNYLSLLLNEEIRNEIEKDTPMGRAAVAIICEYLKEWDGDHPSPPSNHHSDEAPTITPSVMLEYTEFEGRATWRTLVAANFESVKPIGVTRLASDWFQIAELANNTLNHHGTEDQKISAYDSSGTEISIKATTTWQLIYILPTTSAVIGKYIPSSNDIPNCGICYFLVSDKVKDAWNQWASNASLALTEGITQNGLPQGWTLFCAEEVSSISAEAWTTFPSQCQYDSKPTFLSLKDGSRVRAGFKRAYLDYDLPRLLLHTKGVQLNIEGASYSMIEHEDKPEQLPLHREEYQLIPTKGSSLVTITATLNGVTQTVPSFAIYRGQQIEISEASKTGLDRFGFSIPTDPREEITLMGTALLQPK